MLPARLSPTCPTLQSGQPQPDCKGVYALKCRARPTDPVFGSHYYRADGYRIFCFSDIIYTIENQFL